VRTLSEVPPRAAAAADAAAQAAGAGLATAREALLRAWREQLGERLLPRRGVDEFTDAHEIGS
jgi:hypothetical protein